MKSLTLTILLSTLVTTSFAAEATSKPVLLYSRYFNAVGESRYLPDGTYKEILSRLRYEFEVRVHNQPLNDHTLAGVNLVVIANPSDRAVGTNPPPPRVPGGYNCAYPLRRERRRTDRHGQPGEPQP